MAVSQLFVSGSGSGTGRADPVLEIYSTATPVNPLIVHVERDRGGIYHGLEGVDWHPRAERARDSTCIERALAERRQQ